MRSERSGGYWPPGRRAAAHALVMSAAILVSGCGQAQPIVDPLDPAARPQTIVIHTDTGDHTFTVEWALTPSTQSRGLMYRMEMPADHGMVFDFMVTAPHAFWMRNTYIPLDMVFIEEDGTVLHIAENTTPLSDASVPSNGPVRYVLEINGGVADQISLDPGDIVDLQ